MITVFQNWNTVFSLAEKARTGDVSVIVIPDAEKNHKP